jgi:hypothetical protein
MATGSENTALFAHFGGRAFGPGPRRRFVTAAVAVVVVAAATVAVLLITGGGNSSHASNAAASLKYGKIPSWIPQQKAPSDRIVGATAAHPVLAAAEGDTVNAHLRAGTAYVTGVGPSVPNWVQNYAHEGRWTAASLAPSTFTFTIAQPKGAVPLKASAFSILTEAGQIVHPSVTMSGGQPLPATVEAGKPLNLTLKAKLPEGEGALRWAPEGNRVLVAWMYELELD